MAKFTHSLLLCLCILITSCSRERSSNEAQGYVEGRYTYIATSVSGNLQQLLVKRGDQVTAGQLLFQLELQPESDAYKAAQEDYNQYVNARDAIAANLSFAKVTYERNRTLVAKRVVEIAALDRARSEYESLNAQLAQANANVASSRAALAQAKWRLDQKNAYAPVNASVFDVYFRLGEFAPANQAVVSLLAPTDIKVIFYVSQQVLDQVQLRDKVIVSCVGCAKDIIGYISFISPTAEYTPPIIYSNETNQKLVFRLEAQFNPQDARKLHPGQPVRVSYYSHDK